MSIYIYGKRADHGNENRDLREFVRRLLTSWSGQDRNLTLIANSFWDGTEIDVVCLLPRLVLVVDFKSYAGKVTGGENGTWLLDGNVEIKGGNQPNPFQQLQRNKFKVLSWLTRQKLLGGRNLGHIGAAVVFRGPITQTIELPGTIAAWFHVTDMDHCAALLDDVGSPQLDVYQKDVDAIIKAMGVERMPDFEPYGFNPVITQPKDIADGAYEPQPPGVRPPAGPNGTDETAGLKPNERAEFDPKQPAPQRRVKWSLIYLGAAAIILVATVVFTLLFRQTSDGSVPPTSVPQTSASSPEPEPTPPAPVPQPKQEPPADPQPPPRIEAREAPFHVGETVMACGKVAQTRDFKAGVYLNLDAPYPRESLTVVAWDRYVPTLTAKFGSLAELQGKRVCALGKITQHGKYDKHLQISLDNASFLRLMR